MLQLTQVLKYEPYLDCALARFLLARALRNREVGHFFFWFLRAEMQSGESMRYGLLLEAYCRGCGDYLNDLYRQTQVLKNLAQVADEAKVVAKKSRCVGPRTGASGGALRAHTGGRAVLPGYRVSTLRWIRTGPSRCGCRWTRATGSTGCSASV